METRSCVQNFNPPTVACITVQPKQLSLRDESLNVTFRPKLEASGSLDKATSPGTLPFPRQVASTTVR